MTDTIPAWVDGRLVPVDKLDAHRRGLRHKAVSVFVYARDEMLIQRRAPGKYHSPGLWANACCTHPHWGESALASATRRLRQELGVPALPLLRRGTTEYRADVGSGLVEHEVVEIFTAHLPGRIDVTPHPDEVMDTAWLTLDEIAARTRRDPESFAAWFRIYLERGLMAVQPA
jgi:isopentenyl-diphosphate delta-isomerase